MASNWSWRGWGVAALAALTGLVLVGHKHVPNAVGNLGSLLETFLPWVGLAVPVLLVAAILRRTLLGVAAAGLAGVVWLAMFGHLLLPGKGGGEPDLRVLTHNVGVSNTDFDGTARILLDADADLIALQELTNQAGERYAELLSPAYPHHIARGTVALWSKHPLVDGDGVDIGLGWERALRVEVDAPGGTVAVYVVHLASVRVDEGGFSSEQRNSTINDLGGHLGVEDEERVLLLGDLNGTAYDRSLAPLTFGLQSAQAAAGFGFGFTWPTQMPLARIDHILFRGMTATDAWVLERTGSDHRPVAADFQT